MNAARWVHGGSVAAFFCACEPEAARPPTSSDPPWRRAGRAEGESGADVCAYGAHPQAPPKTPACGAAGVCDDDADCAVQPHTHCHASACALAGCLFGQCTLATVAGESCTRDAECAPAPCVVSAKRGVHVCDVGPGGTRTHGP
jgi:hypothetical protein